MKLICNSSCGFTSRTDSRTANSVVMFKGRFSLQKKAKVLHSVPAHRADCNAVRSNSALAAVCYRSRAFSVGQFTLLWRIHLCGLLDWICWESCSLNPLLFKWNSAGFVLCYYHFDLFLERCPWNFWALQQCKQFLFVFHFVKPFLKNQIPKKHLTKLKGKLGVYWRMFVYSQGTDEKLKCATHVLLLPVERELPTTQWKTILFIVCCWLGLIKGFTMIQKSYILWSNTSWSSNFEYFSLWFHKDAVVSQHEVDQIQL